MFYGSLLRTFNMFYGSLLRTFNMFYSSLLRTFNMFYGSQTQAWVDLNNIYSILYYLNKLFSSEC